ncbi:MAG: LacI family DNA-binding transcriptional regulator [Pararobbsia sp.]
MGIKKLASHLNLSIATVSRALNDSAEVSAATRQRVLAAAAQLGYAPNKAAKSLRQGRIDTVGLMLPMRSPDENYTLTLFLTLADGIQSVLTQHQLDLSIYPSHSDEDELSRLRRIVERRQVDGPDRVRHAPSRCPPRLPRETEVSVRRVRRSDSGGEHAWLDLDFEAAAEESIARLVGFRHRRIAIGMPGEDAMQAHVYLRGYRRALKRFGLPFDPALALHDELSERGGYRVTEILLASPAPPTAIMFQSDCMAIGAYRKLSELGLAAGQGHRDQRRRVDGRHARLSVTAPDGFSIAVRELGHRMAEAMLARLPGISAHDHHPLVQEIWPLQLKARSSDTGVAK